MELTEINLASASLALLFVIGAVNIIGMYKPNMDSKTKVVISLLVAFAVSFIPPAFGNVLLDHIKTAIEVAIAGSGLYKVSQVVGDKASK